MNIPPNNPKKLYKYRTFDKDGYYKSLIKNNELFFSSPDKFNDPFDCCAYMDLTKDAKQKIMALCEENYRSQLKHAPKNLVDKTMNVFRSMDDSLFKNKLNMAKVFYEGAKLHGICSLSEKFDNILIWSHYAECHKGFCIEYNVDIMVDKIRTDFQKIENVLALGKVNYMMEYPIINDIFNITGNIDIYFRKHPDWNYEAEWRLLHLNHPNQGIKFPEGIITAIYFGVECPKTDIDKVWELVKDKEHKPKFYKAYKALSSFALEFREINWYR
jgi:hypothetical protein